MTESELHAVMASGFATIAGTVFKVYVDFGVGFGSIATCNHQRTQGMRQSFVDGERDECTSGIGGS